MKDNYSIPFDFDARIQELRDLETKRYNLECTRILNVPVLKKDHTVEDVKQYANDMERHQKSLKVINAGVALLTKEIDDAEKKFHIDMREEYGVTDYPNVDKLWYYAYEHGHSSGLRECVSYFVDIIELVETDDPQVMVDYYSSLIKKD